MSKPQHPQQQTKRATPRVEVEPPVRSAVCRVPLVASLCVVVTSSPQSRYTCTGCISYDSHVRTNEIAPAPDGRAWTPRGQGSCVGTAKDEGPAERTAGAGTYRSVISTANAHRGDMRVERQVVAATADGHAGGYGYGAACRSGPKPARQNTPQKGTPQRPAAEALRRLHCHRLHTA
jgi:hypothetical protein